MGRLLWLYFHFILLANFLFFLLFLHIYIVSSLRVNKETEILKILNKSTLKRIAEIIYFVMILVVSAKLLSVLYIGTWEEYMKNILCIDK